MNKHYAVVKRTKKIIIPKYVEYHSAFGTSCLHERSKIKRIEHYQMADVKDLGCGLVEFKRVIINAVEKRELKIYWKGLINQEVLNIGDNLEINNEVVTIVDVIKSTKGSVTYSIDDFFEKSNNYEELFEKCLIEYNNHKESELPSIQFESEIEEVKNEETGIGKKDTKSSWWKSLFNLK